MIQVSRPSIGREELVAVEKVFATGWLGLGSVVFEFENRVKEYLNAKHVVAVNSGTSALHIALDAFGISTGDEVLVPSLTFAATIQTIVALGAIPVFCEIDRDTLNIDLNDVKKKIASNVKAVMPVHYCGQPCDMETLLEIAGRYNVKVIEDAAHAFGSKYKDKKIGSFGDATCFSFDPIKNITCGEGGAVVLQDDEIAEKIRRKRILGIDKNTWYHYRNERPWFYEVVESGYRYHMSNINAAIGLEQFKKLDKFIARKRKITKCYDDAFKNLKGIEILKNDYENTAQFCYIIKVKKDRDKLIAFLKSREVESGVHYIPNHMQPLFKKFANGLSITEQIAEEILTLPLYYDMTDEDVKLVINSVKDFINGT